MIDALPSHWLALAGVVFLLGLKHGLDPDHLAAIDGLTRFNSARRPLLSRWSGLLFSAGHGVVVTMVAVGGRDGGHRLARSRVARRARGRGSRSASSRCWERRTSRRSCARPRGEMVRPVGLRSRLFERLTRVDHPVLIAAVGAAFALSFDTISQAVLFSLTGSHVAGWILSAGLGLVFTVGMMATDALNGLWVSHLVRSADARAAAASRVMSLAIALMALGIAAIAFARRALPALDERMAAWDTGIGAAVVLGVAASYAVALRISRAPRWNA